MPECDENLVNIDVFMRFPFSVFSVIWACKFRLWDFILEDLEGPGLPYRLPCYAMLGTAEIHDFLGKSMDSSDIIRDTLEIF